MSHPEPKGPDVILVFDTIGEERGQVGCRRGSVDLGAGVFEQERDGEIEIPSSVGISAGFEKDHPAFFFCLSDSRSGVDSMVLIDLHGRIRRLPFLKRLYPTGSPTLENRIHPSSCVYVTSTTQVLEDGRGQGRIDIRDELFTVRQFGGRIGAGGTGVDLVG